MVPNNTSFRGQSTREESAPRPYHLRYISEPHYISIPYENPKQHGIKDERCVPSLKTKQLNGQLVL